MYKFSDFKILKIDGKDIISLKEWCDNLEKASWSRT